MKTHFENTLEAFSLVNVEKEIPSIVIDIRYATPNNFMGVTLYPSALCYVHKNMATVLKMVQAELQSLNLGLKIYDGFRPLSVQKTMWEQIQDARYVANPDVYIGAHIRGAAVDVTLVDEFGNELVMPSGFDEFSERAHLNYIGGDKQALANRDLLQKVMTKHGLEPIDTEWWHFSLPGWNDDTIYPYINFIE